MDYTNNEDILALVDSVDKGINILVLDYFIFHDVKLHFTDFMAMAITAWLQTECKKDWDIGITAKNTSNADTLWINKVYVTREELELLMIKVYEDYHLKGKIASSYAIESVWIQTFQLFIAVILALAYYNKKKVLPAIIDMTFNYEPDKPKPTPAPTPTPAPPAKDLNYWREQIDAVGYLYARYKYSLAVSDAKTMERVGYGDCWAMSDGILNALAGRKVKARIIQYPTSMSQRHRSVQYLFNGQWYNWDYSKYGYDYRFKYTSGVNSGSVYRYNM